MLKTAIAKAGYTDKVVIGMDVAASEFYNESDKLYDLNFKEEVRKLFIWGRVCHIAIAARIFESMTFSYSVSRSCFYVGSPLSFHGLTVCGRF